MRKFRKRGKTAEAASLRSAELDYPRAGNRSPFCGVCFPDVRRVSRIRREAV